MCYHPNDEDDTPQSQHDENVERVTEATRYDYPIGSPTALVTGLLTDVLHYAHEHGVDVIAAQKAASKAFLASELPAKQ